MKKKVQFTRSLKQLLKQRTTFAKLFSVKLENFCEVDGLSGNRKKCQTNFCGRNKRNYQSTSLLKKKKKQRAGSIALMEILEFPQRAGTANFT